MKKKKTLIKDEKATKHWGKERDNYYDRDFEKDSEDEQLGTKFILSQSNFQTETFALAEEEEEEVKRLQKKKISTLQSTDFDDEVENVPKKTPKVCYIFFFPLPKKKAKINDLTSLKKGFDGSTEASRVIASVNRELESISLDLEEYVLGEF